jgi:hypothetical protein
MDTSSSPVPILWMMSPVETLTLFIQDPLLLLLLLLSSSSSLYAFTSY